MSRIGRQPIQVPSGVQVEIKEGVVEFRTKKTTLSSPIPPGVKFEMQGDTLLASRNSDEKPYPAYHGLARALAANCVRGVTEGFSRQLDIVGIGYKAEIKSKYITFSLGYSHPIEMRIPDGVEIGIEKQTRPIQNYVTTVVIKGADKQQVGQMAADIRSLRKPDAYKGKGIRYTNEVVRLKVGKKGA